MSQRLRSDVVTAGVQRAPNRAMLRAVGFGDGDFGKPIDEDLYEIHDERKKLIKQVPGSLGEAIDALEKDQAFLLEGDVFTPDVLETWITMKRTKDIAPVNLRPHPYEFFLYYDA